MLNSDRGAFFTLLADVYAFYGKEFSEFAGNVWWSAMSAYDLKAVREALGRHCVNPDAGQYLPKPADVVRMLQGGTQDSALQAWAKVDRALRQVGTYQSVAFDDALIHRVLHDMGGWVLLGTKTEDDWPFVAKEFENRYRGYRMRSERPEYPPVLVGHAEAQNARLGFATQPPVLIGNAQQAQATMLGGASQSVVAFTRLTETAPGLRLAHSRGAA
jgi:hypothetical protein